jgi:phage portal protein BeeE
MSKTAIVKSNVYGTKSITFDQYPDEAWDFVSGDPGGLSDSVKEMWANVPWLYAGVNIISQSAAEIPVALYRGKEEITSSEDWQDPTGYLPDWGKLCRKMAASLTLEGQGYLFRDQAATVRATKKLVFWNPTTVQVNWKKTKATNSLWFTRTVNGKSDDYDTQQVIYFWPDDGYTEVGPPASSPAKAALAAAGVLYNADKYVSAYWERGAVRATILGVKGAPNDGEKKKLETWWKSITGGVRKAFNVFAMNADVVTPTIVGDGLEGLQNTALTNEKREDISTALGVPQSILFSTNAGGLGGAGVVTGDRVNLYELTVIPLVKLICATLNEQQFKDTGYRLVVNENEMPMYQEDESARATALNSMITALQNPEQFLLASDIIGFEIDDETRAKIEALISKKDQNREALAEQMKPAETPPSAPVQDEQDEPDDDEAMQKAYAPDVARWRRKALKHGGAVDFVSDTIPAELHAKISERLRSCVTPDEIKAAFDPEPSGQVGAILALAAAINRAVENG